MSRSCAKRWIALIWLLSCTITLPWAYYFQLQMHDTYQDTDEMEATSEVSTINRSTLPTAQTMVMMMMNELQSIAADSEVPSTLVAGYPPTSVSPKSGQDEAGRNITPALFNYMVCIEIWPNETSERTYFVLANLILCYVLPLLLISACYIAIWIKVWRRTVPGETGTKSLRKMAALHRSNGAPNRTRSEQPGVRSNGRPKRITRTIRWWTQKLRLHTSTGNASICLNAKRFTQNRSNHNRSPNDSINTRSNGTDDQRRSENNNERFKRFGRLICGEPEISSTSFDFSEQSIQTIQQVPPRPPPTPEVPDALPQPLSLCDLVQPAVLKRYLSSEQLQSQYAQKILDRNSIIAEDCKSRCSIKKKRAEERTRKTTKSPTIDLIRAESDELTKMNGKRINSTGNLLKSESCACVMPTRSSCVTINRSTCCQTSPISHHLHRPPTTVAPNNSNFASPPKSVRTPKASLMANRGQLLCASTSAQLGLKMELILQRSKLKVAKMMIIVVMIFFLSWLPLYFVFTKLKLGLQFTRFPNAEDRFTIMMAPFAQWLGASNSCINPLLYAFFNKKYRKEFVGLLHKMRSNRCLQWLCSRLRCTSALNESNGTDSSAKLNRTISTLPPVCSNRNQSMRSNNAGVVSVRASATPRFTTRLTNAAQMQRFDSMSEEDFAPSKPASYVSPAAITVASINFV